MGCPTHEPTHDTRLIVKELSGLGIPQKQIAKRIGVGSDMTLAKHYQEELDLGAADANQKVANFLFCAASGMALELDTGATYRDCVTAAIFWAKIRMKWTEPRQIDLTVTAEIGERLERARGRIAQLATDIVGEAVADEEDDLL